jgi:hypothetical protein
MSGYRLPLENENTAKAHHAGFGAIAVRAHMTLAGACWAGAFFCGRIATMALRISTMGRAPWLWTQQGMSS